MIDLVARAAAAEGRTGGQVYRQMCASCHGAAGEGTAAKYPHPLVGNRSVGQLARYITKNMPEDAPGIGASIPRVVTSPAKTSRAKAAVEAPVDDDEDVDEENDGDMRSATTPKTKMSEGRTRSRARTGASGWAGSSART